MPLETTPFDPAEYLDTPESQMELLLDAAESGDARYIAEAIGTVARARKIKNLTAETGLSRAALYRAFSKDGNPRLSTMLSVMRSLGLKLSFDRIEQAV